MRTIDMTPTWVGILPALIAIIENGNEAGKRNAYEELRRMAEIADDYNAFVAKHARTTEG